jgi:hypothetical protein
MDRGGARTRRARVAVAAASAMVALAAPATAFAAVRTGFVNDGIDAQDTTPSLTSQPESREVVAAAVDYDEAGSVRAAVTLNQPANQYDYITVDLYGAKRCADELAEGDKIPRLRIILDASPSLQPNGDRSPRSRATLEGFTSEVQAPTEISADGLSLAASFANPNFATHDYRCSSGWFLADSSDGRSDDFKLYFKGYEPQKLTTKAATAQMVAELTRRYGERYTSAAGKWLKCPKEELSKGYEDEAPFAICRFRFKDGARWRAGAMTFKLVDQYLTVDQFDSATFTRTLKTCHIRRNLRSLNPQVLNRRLRADGWVTCFDGPISMVRDLHGPFARNRRIVSVGFHGTNHAGFEDADLFRCRVTVRNGRHRATCANKLGDRFIYSFTLRTKPKPASEKRRSGGHSAGCDPNYKGACLKPKASDYDCAGGSGDGPYYVHGPITVVGDDHYGLDADGNGTACES